MKNYILLILLTCFVSIAYPAINPVTPSNLNIIIPSKLHSGDTVGLVASAFSPKTEQDIEFAKERLEALGLKVVEGKSLHKKYGYLAGTDFERAQDINEMFANPKVTAIFEIRGGGGSVRILPYLDYKLIQEHPKIIMGFSDITNLLLAIYTKTGLVTFHGPLAGWGPWPDFTVSYIKKVLFNDNEITIFQNPNHFDLSKDLIQTDYRIHVINEGKVTGQLIGGNLSTLVQLIGTPYMPDMKGKILFLEDTHRYYYQVDENLAQLKNAGILNQISGFVFGECVDCQTLSGDSAYNNFSLEEILDQYIKPLHIPAWSGAAIGHAEDNFTLPEGGLVEIDANQGTIRLLAPAVK